MDGDEVMSTLDEAANDSTIGCDPLSQHVEELEIEAAHNSIEEDDRSPGTQTFTMPPLPSSAPSPAPPVKPRSDFKYKYIEAGEDGGCPDGITEEEWNKIYTAADSRIYNRCGKNANASRARRQTGETRTLALEMYQQKVAKASGVGPPVDFTSLSSTPRPYMPKSSSSKITHSVTFEPLPQPEVSFADGRTPLSLAEQIKMGGRDRKVSIPFVGSIKQESPGPHVSPSISTAPKPPRKKPGPKKRDGIAGAKKTTNKAKPDGTKYNAPATVPGDDNKPPTLADFSFPSIATASSAFDDPESGSDDGIYCICKKPDDHRLMLACEGGCDDWYHCSCMRIDEADVDEERNGLLDRFICPLCTVRGGDNPKVTTWKPMCRYFNVAGCRKAAGVTADPPSKYCSDEHKVAFWVFVRDKLARQDDAPSMGGRLNVHEIGAILTHAKTHAEIQALGKKPRLPVPDGFDGSRSLALEYLTPEEQVRIDEIKAKRVFLEGIITTFQKQQKLGIMIQARHKAALNNPTFRAEYKDFCGYDNRISFNEPQFERWAKSTEGCTVMATGVLGPRTPETQNINGSIPIPNAVVEEPRNIPDALQNLCLKGRKKCTKHGNGSWLTTHITDFRYQEQLHRVEVKRLEGKEREIVEDAETREATKEYDAENTTEVCF